MTRASLIEAAAIAYDIAYVAHLRSKGAAVTPQDRPASHLAGIEAALSAIAPPGEAWIAPWEASEAMNAASIPICEGTDAEVAAAEFRAARDAHLKETEEGMPDGS